MPHRCAHRCKGRLVGRSSGYPTFYDLQKIAVDQRRVQARTNRVSVTKGAKCEKRINFTPKQRKRPRVTNEHDRSPSTCWHGSSKAHLQKLLWAHTCSVCELLRGGNKNSRGKAFNINPRESRSYETSRPKRVPPLSSKKRVIERLFENFY